MKQHLSQADVERLLRDRSTGPRAEVAAKIGLQVDAELTQTERALAEDILRRFARDAEVEVRHALAEHVKASRAIPRDVAVALARDVEQVALPIIQMSKVLSDADLIEIVRGGSSAKQSAVAEREGVSEAVSDALIRAGSEQAVVKLLKNSDAKIAEGSYTAAVKRFVNSEAVTDSLAQRDRLPATIAERLVAMMSDRLVQQLATRHDLNADMQADMILQARERATANVVGSINDDEVLTRLVQQLAKSGRLSPSLILRMLCTGDVGFLEASLSHFAKVPLTNVRTLVNDSGDLGLRSLYQRSTLPMGLLPAVRVALSVIAETEYDGGDDDRKRFRRRIIERILTQYEDMAADDLNYLIDKLGDLAE